ncbi:hypothetical protein LMH87_012038 [Akanthomyces muscarius]|uniref:Velvet domain-containing protein n=1 Tax=Akanthomyces muscarius TaxID=2231603 RepID=A0A9W8QAB9_AKAMU|nr:hypothetical protein LMH87_012038 [Akanthomyces muscarius]KAJ4151332.1 hypothetical protein LMH87_012038 [Akanthomyces muscarius]
MNPPYQPPGPQQAFPNPMPPPEGPPNYQRSTSSQLQLPAPRQLLQYADSYRHASSQSLQSQPRLQSVSASLPPHQPSAPPPPQPQHYQPPHPQQQHQLPAINPNHASRRGSHADEATLAPANTPSNDAKPAQALLTPVSDVDLVVGYKYQLDVIQQPKRARMCGFGDKDRRPITPPPCVRLSIIDIATGKEINYNEIDHAMFVLNVDLWNAEGTREVNLVRSSAASSSASSSSTNAPGFAPRNVAEASHGMSSLPLGREAPYSQQRPPPNPPEYAGHASYHNGSNTYRGGGNYALPLQHYPQHHGYGMDQPMPPQSDGGHSRAASASDGYGQEPGVMPRLSCIQLVRHRRQAGYLVCSTRPQCPNRRKFPPSIFLSKVTTGRAPILASSHSEVFSVFSAKKFPGVCESTALSKTFAAQGIKIPIRKEAGGKGDDEDGYGD